MYCSCGTEINIDSRWNGLVHRIVFLHDGEEISECPGCGEGVGAWVECDEARLVYRRGALLDTLEGVTGLCPLCNKGR